MFSEVVIFYCEFILTLFKIYQKMQKYSHVLCTFLLISCYEAVILHYYKVFFLAKNISIAKTYHK